MSTKATATPASAEAPVWPAVDPTKLGEFNAAVSKGAQQARAAADCFEQYQLGRMSKDDFELRCHELLDGADDEFHKMVELLTPVEPPVVLRTADTYARTTRDTSKPWPTEAA